MPPYEPSPTEILNSKFGVMISTPGEHETLQDKAKWGTTLNLNRADDGKESTRSMSANQSSNATIAELARMQKPLHKAEFGGPKSPFVPVVRLPSNKVVGLVKNKTSYEDFNKSKSDSSIGSGGKKFSKLLQDWQTREERYVNAIPQKETMEYRFRPILADDEKYQFSIPIQPKPSAEKVKKKKMRTIPVIEISFFDDESLDTLSSMGYDGSEHDLDAIFKYEVFETEAYFDEDYFEDRNDEHNEIRQTEGFEIREIEPQYSSRGINEDQEQSKKYRYHENEIVESIEKDPDLSVANSTIQKQEYDNEKDHEKDHDLSIDADEHFDITTNQQKKEEATENIYEQNVIDNFCVNDKAKYAKEPKQESVGEFDSIAEEENSPPPLPEVFIPVTHPYGYGYYLKPLWKLEDRPKIKSTEKLQRIKKLINEGRQLRSKREVTRLIIKTQSR